MVESQSSDSGNRLAGVVLIAELSSCCHSKKFAAACQFPPSVSSRRPIAAKTENRFQAGNVGKLIAMI
jgi:hypothetical protein